MCALHPSFSRAYGTRLSLIAFSATKVAGYFQTGR